MKHQRAFGFTSIAWEEFDDKLDVLAIRNLINQNLMIEKYGNGVKRIVFLYIADDWHKRKEYKAYDAKEKTIYLNLKLEYEAFKKANKTKALSMMALLYLKSIALYDALGVQDFDSQLFYDDVERLFLKERWLSLQPAI